MRLRNWIVPSQDRLPDVSPFSVAVVVKTVPDFRLSIRSTDRCTMSTMLIQVSGCGLTGLITIYTNWSGICNINAVSILINTHTVLSTDPSSVPKRCRPVYGVSLLWQPEVIYVYLAVIEQYSSCSEAVEAAAGAIQNLTACNWKVRKFMERKKGGGGGEKREIEKGERERDRERFLFLLPVGSVQS